MRRALILLVLLVLIGALGVGFWGMREGQDREDTLGALREGDNLLLAREAETYRISAAYPAKPIPTGGTDENARALDSMETWIASTTAEFSSFSTSLSPEERQFLGESGRKYELDITYKPYVSLEAGTVSYEFDIYADTGGAHPNFYFHTFTFDERGEEVALGDLFEPDSEYLETLSEKALASVRADLSERLGEDAAAVIFAEGLSPRPENFQNFVLSDDAFILLVPPYQAAAYAAGSFSVRIPFSLLGAFLPGKAD